METLEMSMEKRLSINDVCKYLGISRVTLYRWMNTGYLPKPEKWGERILRWKASDIERYIAARNAPPAPKPRKRVMV